MAYLTLGDLDLSSPTTAKYIKNLQVWEEVNCHGKVEVTFIPETALSVEDILKLEEETITLQTTEGDDVFHGTVLQVAVRNEASYQEVTLFGGTDSIKEDLGKESAIFQDENKTLSDITDLMSSLTVTLTDDLTIGDMLFQNKESNFSFARRIANEYRQFLMVDCKNAGNPVYIGNDPISVKTLGDVVTLQMKKSIHSIEKLKYGADSSAEPFQYAQDFLEVDDLTIGVGVEVNHDSQDKLVISSHITTEKGLLVNKIALVGSAGQAPSGKFAAPVIPRGYVVLGEVKAVTDNTVQVEFFSETDTMLWLPYENTINNYCYAMPDVGDSVYVYHHPQDLSKTICLGSYHVNDHNDFQTTTTKVFTSENCMIQFEAAALHLTGNRSTFEDDTTEYISLKDSGGIEIISDEDIKIQSDGDLLVFAGKAHNGLSSAQTTFLAESSAGYTQLLTGAGIALGVPPVAIPSTVVALCKTDTDACLDLPSDFADVLEDLEETMTEGNSPTNSSEGKVSVLATESVKLIVKSTSLEITKDTFNIASSLVLM